MKLIKLTTVTIALIWLSACSSSGGSKNVTIEDRNTNKVERDLNKVEKDRDSAETQVIAGNGEYQSEDLLDGSSPLLSNRVVYFEYDSSTVREEDVKILEAHAIYLGNNINATMRLFGHTDKRGSREYNLALGERRALAIRQILLLQGASIKQLEVTSFGEERPEVEGEDESSWQQNRRVELKYVGQ